MSKKKYAYDKLLDKYGKIVLSIAVNYFDRKGLHCTIDDIEKKCKELKGKSDGTI